METDYPLVLASASPRRHELLQQIGLDHEVCPADEADEPEHEGESPEAYARRGAEAKALAVSRDRPEAIVLGADTVVAVDERALGKPVDDADARRMLRDLSGRGHIVYTGVVLAHGGRIEAADVVATTVAFRALREDEIDAYVATGETSDKAGAYGIQGRGAVLVQGIEGCYSNVVGLPLSRTAEMLGEVRAALKPGSGDPKC